MARAPSLLQACNERPAYSDPAVEPSVEMELEVERRRGLSSGLDEGERVDQCVQVSSRGFHFDRRG